MAEHGFNGWVDFGTPFFSAKNPDADLNPALTEFFLELEQQGERYRNPDRTPSHQVEIFESAFDLFNWNQPSVQAMRQFCMANVWRAVQQCNGYSVEHCKGLQAVVDSWFHITRTGGYIATHTHPMASWSGVYMVDPGGEPEGDELGGVINFKDTRPQANMYIDPGNQRMQRPFSHGSINYPMKPGDLMLFPSWVQHEVTPYLGRKPRITVAFNCSFKRRGERD